RPTGVDPLVVLRMMNQERRFYPAHLVERGLAAVKRHGSPQACDADRQHVRYPAAETEADAADAAIAALVLPQVGGPGNEVLEDLVAIAPRLHFPALIIGAGVAAERRQCVRSKSDH